MGIGAGNANITSHNILLVGVECEDFIHVAYMRVHYLAMLLAPAVEGALCCLKEVGILKTLRGVVKELHYKSGVPHLNGKH